MPISTAHSCTSLARPDVISVRVAPIFSPRSCWFCALARGNSNAAAQITNNDDAMIAMRRIDGFVILLSLWFYDRKMYEQVASLLIHIRLSSVEQTRRLALAIKVRLWGEALA